MQKQTGRCVTVQAGIARALVGFLTAGFWACSGLLALGSPPRAVLPPRRLKVHSTAPGHSAHLNRTTMDLRRIAQTLRETRRKQGLTLTQLARKSGFSPALISRVETCDLTPSLNALARLTEALGMEMSALFGADPAGPAVVPGNLAQGEVVPSPTAERYGMTSHALAYARLDRALDPFVVEYHPASEKRGLSSHDTDEFLVVLDGNVELLIGDQAQRRQMGSGDTVFVSRNVPHTVWLTEGCDYARALIIYSVPPSTCGEGSEETRGS